MTKIDTIRKERVVVADAIDKAKREGTDPFKLIQKLWHLTCDLADEQAKVDKKHKGDCLFE